MNRLPDDETREGMACHKCGDDADSTVEVAEGYGRRHVPLCDACYHDHTTRCPQCETRIWQADGYRLYSTPELYCPSCAQQHPALIEGYITELLTDERQDR